MFTVDKYAGTVKMQGFLSQMKQNGGMRAILVVAALLMLGLFNPVFATGFIFAVKILQGLSVLGGIFY